MKRAFLITWILAVVVIAAGCDSDSDDVITNGGTDDEGCAPSEEMATYVVTFESTWSETTHPDDFPSNPHFSRLVGGTHNADVTFWEVGEIASDGIEAMAELGSRGPLESEVGDAVTKGTAGRVLSGGGIGTSPGEVSYEFEIHKDFPLVTLVSMLAPSPDWFVGVSGLTLCDGEGWADSVTVRLFAYDAGTDSGSSYTSPDEDTNPPEPIFRIGEPPFLVGDGLPPVGSFTFVRQTPMRPTP
jgi:hypothetical protein